MSNDEQFTERQLRRMFIIATVLLIVTTGLLIIGVSV